MKDSLELFGNLFSLENSPLLSLTELQIHTSLLASPFSHFSILDWSKQLMAQDYDEYCAFHPVIPCLPTLYNTDVFFPIIWIPVFSFPETYADLYISIILLFWPPLHQSRKWLKFSFNNFIKVSPLDSLFSMGIESHETKPKKIQDFSTVALQIVSATMIQIQQCKARIWQDPKKLIIRPHKATEKASLKLEPLAHKFNDQKIPTERKKRN